MADSNVEKQWRNAERVLAKYRKNILRRSGVLGVSVAFRLRRHPKTKKLRATREVAICISVRHKRDVPKNMTFREDYDGVPVCIIDARAKQLAGSGVHPGMGVFATSLGAGQAGTLGLVVREAETPAPVYLTCDHVVPTAGSKVQGLSLPGQAVIGTVAPKKENQRSMLVDCALIVPQGPHVIDLNIPGFPGRCRLGRIKLEDAINRSPVVKVGAKTGPTRGRVHRHDASVLVNDTPMIGQIAIEDASPDDEEPFSEGGDSGAVVFRDEPGPPWEVVGLLHAKEEGTGMGIACHFKHVAEVLEVFFKQP